MPAASTRTLSSPYRPSSVVAYGAGWHNGASGRDGCDNPIGVTRFPPNIDDSSAAVAVILSLAVGHGGQCNDYNITTEDASAARSVRGARPLDLKEVSGRSVLARQRAGF